MRESSATKFQIYFHIFFRVHGAGMKMESQMWVWRHLPATRCIATRVPIALSTIQQINHVQKSGAKQASDGALQGKDKHHE